MGQTCSGGQIGEDSYFSDDEDDVRMGPDNPSPAGEKWLCGMGCGAPALEDVNLEDGLTVPLLKNDSVPPLLKRQTSWAVGQSSPSYSTPFPPLLEHPGPKVVGTVVAAGVCLGLGLTVFREFLASCGVSSDTLLEYFSIPVVSVLFTYFHIWVALWLTFYPIKFVGCYQIPDTNTGLGWQGIMPNKAGKMARMSVELMTEKLINVKEIVERIDVEEVVGALRPVLSQSVEDCMVEVLSKLEPGLWAKSPEKLKKSMKERALRNSPQVVSDIVTELKEDIENYFDVKEMVENAFTQEPELLNHMFIKCGYVELQFIRDCGAYMGGFFGIIQVILWIFYSAGWMLPTFGFVVGILSNYLALKMIFEPVEEIRVGYWKVQGLFLRRQKEVAEVYAEIVADNVLSARNILRAIVRGRLQGEFAELLQRHVAQSVDSYLGHWRKPVMAVRSPEYLAACKSAFATSVMKRLPHTTQHVEKYMEKSMALEDLLREKLETLPSRDFEGLLHPVFQEDEWKLVLMGGVLGIVIGCMQWKVLGA